MANSAIKKRISTKFFATLLSVALVILAAIITLASTITLSFATAATAKSMGDGWNTFLNKADGIAKTSAYDFTANKAQIFPITKVYNELSPIFNSGVTPAAAEVIYGPLITRTDAKYKNGTGASPAGYNYCFTISNAQELVMFSYLTIGRDIGNASGTPYADVANFFKNANVKLGNNINFAAKGNTEYGSATIASVAPAADSGGYYSNGSYLGYGSGGVVLKPFAPIVGFGGQFDGQNFDIANLTILKNGSKTTPTVVTDYNASNYDAFFATVVSGGVVKSFGLSSPKFATVTGMSGTHTNTAAGICGSNAGAISSVYCTNATGATVSLTVADGTAATTHYTGTDGTIVNTDDADRKLTEPYWYGGTDLLPQGFPKLAHRLSGLKYTAVKSYSVKSVADFVTYTNIYKEGFTNKAGTKIAISENLDFRYVGEFAIIPNVCLAGAQETTLYSVSDNGVSDALTNGSVFENRKTLINMRLNAFLYHEAGRYLSYGLYYDSTYANSVIKVYNLNFVNCNISIGENSVSPTNNTAAGLIVGRSKMNVDLRGISSDGSVMTVDKKDNAFLTAYGTHCIGGLVGKMDNTSAGATYASFNLDSICMTGEVYSGNRNCSNANFSTGGIVGRVDTALMGNGNQQAEYKSVYFGGTVTGFLSENYDTTSAVGGLIGSGVFCNNTGDVVKGVYIDGKIISNIVGSKSDTDNYPKTTLSIGGVIGDIAVGGDQTTRGTITSIANVKVVGEIVVNAVSGTSSYYLGAFVGKAQMMTIGGTQAVPLKTSDLLSDGTTKQCKITINPADKVIVNSSLYWGGLFGQISGGFSVTNVTNNMPIVASAAKFKNVYVGGIVGNVINHDGTFSNLKNSGNIAITVTGSSGSNIRTANTSGIVGNTGNSAFIQYENCENSAEIAFTMNGSAAEPVDVAVSGIADDSASALLSAKEIKNCKNSGKLSVNIKNASGNVYVNGISHKGTNNGNTNSGDLEVTSADILSKCAVYINGITQDGTVKNCSNTTAPSGKGIVYSATTSGTSGVANLSGIAYASLTISDCENLGKMSATGAASVINMGGITATIDLAKKGVSVINNINSGALTAQTASELNMGGIVGYSSGNGGVALSGSINNGALSATTATAINQRVGGIIGSAGFPITINECYNMGSVTTSGGSVGVGGILGYAGSTATITDCFNFGAITETTAGATSGVGGILGYGVGAITINDCVNKAAISGSSAVGGLVGNSVCSNAICAVSGLNYGNVSASGTLGVGGIVGSGNYITIYGVNYGEVSATNAGGIGGGILGVGSGQAEIKSSVNYGKAIGANVYGILGVRGKLTMAIFVDPMGAGSTKTTRSDANAADTHAYIANNGATGAKTLTELYGNTFILSPKALGGAANEETYYKSYGGSMLAWSEKPYKNNNVSHAGALTDTNCFALTTISGRNGGKYIGDNYSAASIDAICNNKPSASLAVTLKSELNTALATCKQITMTRDTFVNNTKSYIQLYDKTVTTGAIYANMPKTNYYAPTDISPHRFVSTLDYSANYLNNRTRTDMNGLNVIMRNSFSADLFSAGAKYDKAAGGKYTIDTVNTKSYTFNYNQNAAEKITTAYMSIFQGDSWQGGTKNDNGTWTETTEQQRWREMYSTEYQIVLNLYQETPTFTMNVPDGSYTLASKDNVLTQAENSTATTENLSTAPTSTKVSPDEITYAKPTVKWNYGKITATFAVDGISGDYLMTNNGLSDKWTLGFYDSKNVAVTGFCTYWAGISVKSMSFEGNNIYRGTLNITLNITDRFVMAELPTGDYTFRIQLRKTAGGTDYFTRIIPFTKLASGDVFLYSQNNGKPIEKATEVNLGLTSVEEIQKNPTAPQYKYHNTTITAADPTANGLNYGFGFSGTAFYGALPHIKLANSLDFFKQAGLSINSYKARATNISSPKVDVKFTDGTRSNYTFDYTFTITAENGTTGSYVFSFTMPLPVGNLTVAGNDKSISMTETRSVTANYTNVPASSPLYETRVNYAVKAGVTQAYIGSINGQGGGDSTWNTGTMVKPSVSLDTTTKVLTWGFNSQTSGGVYSFTQYYKYSSSIPTSALPTAMFTIKNSNDTTYIETNFELGEFTIGGHTYTVTKESSKNAYLHDYELIGNNLSGAELIGYAHDTSGTITNTHISNPNNKIGQFDYAEYYKNPEDADYLTNRIKRFSIVYNFPDAYTGADYSAKLRFKFYTTNHTTTPTKWYNDEYTEIYLMKLDADGKAWVSDQKVGKTGYTSANVVTTDKELTDYYMIDDIFMPESSVVRLRVVAGNPGYYTEYELFSKGPLRNKTFVFNVSTTAQTDPLADAFSDRNFILNMYRSATYDRIENGVTTTITINSHAAALLFMPKRSGDIDPNFGAGLQADSAYLKRYTSSYYSAGTYSISLLSVATGYSAEITSVTSLLANTATKMSATEFKYEGEGIDTVTINITLRKLASPPWGDNIFA